MSRRQNVGSLNHVERRALKYAMEFGIHTPEAARQWLSTHLERVKQARAEREATTGKSIPSKQNEIPEFEFLLAHANEAFTPKLASVAKQEGERAAKVGRLDPGVSADAAVRRRYVAQAELLGDAGVLTDEQAKAAVREAEKGVKEAEAVKRSREAI